MIEPCHVDFARSRRPRMSFQALAAMLNVHEADLRRACGEVAPERPSAKAPASQRRGVYRGRFPSATVRVLALLEDGPKMGAFLSAEVGITRPTLRGMVSRLRRAGFVADAGGAGRYQIRCEGRDELARVRAEGFDV